MYDGEKCRKCQYNDMGYCYNEHWCEVKDGKQKKMANRFVIDYGFGRATLVTPRRAWRQRFLDLAVQCFGLRKSIGQLTLISAEYGALYAPMVDGEYESITHDGDLIIWDKDGNKIKDEFDD